MVGARIGGLLAGRTSQVALRRFYQRPPEGWPGHNLPFALAGNTLGGRVMFTAKMCMYLAPPFWFPFFLVQYHLKKNNA